MQSFTSVDPLKGKTLNVSSYVYCYNNPIHYIDPDGRFSSKLRSDVHRFFNGGKKNGESYELKDGLWGYNKATKGFSGANLVLGSQKKGNTTGGKPDQPYGDVFSILGGMGNGFGTTAKLLGSRFIDVTWLFLGVSKTPKNKGEWFYEMAKKFDFFSGFINVPRSGVEMDIPEMNEPDPKIVIVYNSKHITWTKVNSHASSGQHVIGYDTVPKSDIDSVVKERMKENENFHIKELGREQFNEYNK